MADSYVLHCEGSLTFCTDGLPDALFSAGGTDQRFLYCWKDGGWGVSTEIGRGQSGMEGGDRVRVAIEVRQGDSELLKLQASTRLQERVSGNVRTSAVGTGGVPLDSLLEGKEVAFVLAGPFSKGNCVQGTMRATNADDFANGKTGAKAAGKPLIQLRPTALRSLPAYNAAIDAIAKSVQDNLQSNHIGMPPGGEMFRAGISSWEFGGAVLSDGTQLPNFGAHYSLMGEQELHLERRLPVAYALYGIYLRMQHSGLTLKQVQALPPRDKANFFFSGCGLNFDAHIISYCPDFEKGIQMSPLAGLDLGQRGSEDWVSPVRARATVPVFAPPAG